MAKWTLVDQDKILFLDDELWRWTPEAGWENVHDRGDKNIPEMAIKLTKDHEELRGG